MTAEHAYVTTTAMDVPLSEVLEEEPTSHEAIPVDVRGAVQTRELPTENGGYATYAMPIDIAIKILDADPRRKHAILIVADKVGASRGITIGGKQSEAAEDIGFNIPLYGPATVATAFAHPPITITSDGELWAIANGTTCKVSVMNEQWTD